MTATTGAALAGACLLAAIGVALLVAPRREGSWATRVRLAGVGTVSTVTLLVAGLVCVALAYQIGVRVFNSPIFRVPAWLALVGSGVAIGLSLVTDAIENRRDDTDVR